MLKWEKIKEYIETTFSIGLLIRLLLLFTLFFIVYLTSDFWTIILKRAWGILRPFFFGFILAYILHPIVLFFEKKNIKKRYSIPVIYLLLLCGVGLLLFTLIPLLYNRVIEFFDTIYININYIERLLIEIDNKQVMSVIQGMLDEVVTYINSSYRELLLFQISGNLTSLVGLFFDYLVVFLLTIITSIYMLFDFENMKRVIKHIGEMFLPHFSIYMDACDDEVHIYIQSVIVLMAVKLVEYTFLYYLIGHHDFLLLGFLTAIGLFVPYFGAMIANGVGILTTLHLGVAKVLVLIIAIAILSNIDAYVIAPMIHSKRSVISPLWILFAVLIGGSIYGVIGVFLAIPVLLIVRSIIQTYQSFSLSNEAD